MCTRVRERKYADVKSSKITVDIDIEILNTAIDGQTALSMHNRSICKCNYMVADLQESLACIF